MEKRISIFDVVSEDNIIAGSMLDELIHAVEDEGFNPSAPILRVVDFSADHDELDVDIAGAISAMNNARISFEYTSDYSEFERFRIYTAEWHAEMSVDGEWYSDHYGDTYFSGRPDGWWVHEPPVRNTAKVRPGFAKFGIPLSQPLLGRAGITVRYYYLKKEEDKSYSLWCDDSDFERRGDYGFKAFKYADKPDEAFKFRSEELIELNKPQFDRYRRFGMYVEWSPNVKEAAVKARLLAALEAVKS